MTNYFRIIKVIGRLLCSFKGKVIKWILKDSFTGGVAVGLCVANLRGTMEESRLSSLDSHPVTFYPNSCKWRKRALFCNWIAYEVTVWKQMRWNTSSTAQCNHLQSWSRWMRDIHTDFTAAGILLFSSSTVAQNT